MQLVPLQNQIVAKRDDPDSRFNGLIWIPDSAQGDSNLGVVIDVGPGRQLDNGRVLAMQVKPGDFILWHKDAGIDITLPGNERLTLLNEDKVLCIREENVG
jgi:chaperonin GroES